MRCLFISNTRHTATQYRDGSARYRCYNIAEELTRQQYRANVCAMHDVTVQVLEKYDVAIFLRPEMSRRLLQLINFCAQKNINVVADFDDLLFQPDRANELPSVLDKRCTIKQARQISGKYRDALMLFSRVSVATTHLVQHVKAVAPTAQVHHLPNGLSPWWLSRNQHLDHRAMRQDHLLYLPGTRSHDHDFKRIATTLQQILGEDPDLKLRLIGPLTIDSNLFVSRQLQRGPGWVEFDSLPEHIRDARACLAPLSHSTFNQCKSHIKFLEAAAFGTPLIATPIPDMQQHKVEGLFFPTSLTDWRHCASKLRDPEYLEYCSDRLYEYVRSNCSNESQIPALASFYSSGSPVQSQKTNRPANDYEISYSPDAVTLTPGNNKIGKRLFVAKRKLRKLKNSPRHFFQDSKLGYRFRNRTNHESQ